MVQKKLYLVQRQCACAKGITCGSRDLLYRVLYFKLEYDYMGSTPLQFCTVHLTGFIYFSIFESFQRERLVSQIGKTNLCATIHILHIPYIYIAASLDKTDPFDGTYF